MDSASPSNFCGNMKMPSSRRGGAMSLQMSPVTVGLDGAGRAIIQ